MNKGTQHYEILKALKSAGKRGLTNYEIATKLGIMYPWKRIAELVEKGQKINFDWRTRHGATPLRVYKAA